MEPRHNGRRARRSFSPEFKAQTVELVRESGRSIPEVARDLDLTVAALRDWVRQADVDDGRRDGLTTDEKAELVRLRRENKVLREEREILKKGGCRTNPDHPARVSRPAAQSGSCPTTSSLPTASS